VRQTSKRFGMWISSFWAAAAMEGYYQNANK